MAGKEWGIILKNEALIKGFIYRMDIHSPKMVNTASAGQFLEIKTGHSPLLRKPISLFGIDQEKGNLSLLYQVKGEGTKNLMNLQPGDSIDLLGPLGKGFSITKPQEKKNLLVGGGIGIAPLYQLGRELLEQGCTFEFILGFASKELSYALNLFEALAPVKVATMDGSLGTKGTVEAILETENLSQVDTLYSCGPEPMLKYIQSLGNQVKTQLSLEAYMGCGLGACLSCVCTKKDGDYARVCKEGPVFKGDEVVLS